MQITCTNDGLFFHPFRFQDVFSEKSFTVAYHGRKSVFIRHDYDSKFKHHHAHLMVLQRATTPRLDALGFNLQSVISIFDVYFSELKPIFKNLF